MDQARESSDTVLWRMHREGKSVPEIARYLGITESRVLDHLFHHAGCLGRTPYDERMERWAQLWSAQVVTSPSTPSAAIPESLWEWQGHAGHFCGSDNCMFRLCTVVGGYLVSTVGDWFPMREKVRVGEKQPLSSVTDSFFETMVFPATPMVAECGCRVPAVLTPLETRHYATVSEAQAGHMALCRKYACLPPPSNEETQEEE